MYIVRDFIAADRTHICVKALAYTEAVLFKSVALPLRERLNDLGFPAVLLFDIKRDRALHTVQIVVESGFGINEQRSRYAQKIQTFGQKILKEILDNFNRHLRFMQV